MRECNKELRNEISLAAEMAETLEKLTAFHDKNLKALHASAAEVGRVQREGKVMAKKVKALSAKYQTETEKLPGGQSSETT